MSAGSELRPGYYPFRAYADPSRQAVTVTEIASQPRLGGEIHIAVLSRPGASPLVSLQHVRPGGGLGARTEFQLDELDDLERAIELARRS